MPVLVTPICRVYSVRNTSSQLVIGSRRPASQQSVEHRTAVADFSMRRCGDKSVACEFCKRGEVKIRNPCANRNSWTLVRVACSSEAGGGVHRVSTLTWRIHRCECLLPCLL